MTQIIKKVLVTGGAGFIGSNLAPLLIGKGYNVTVFDNLTSGKKESLSKIRDHPNFKFIHGDIRNKEALNEALFKIDAVVHLAALIDVTASVADPDLTHEVNVTGTLNVLQQATKNNVKKLVFASSTAVYGDDKKLPVKENTPLHPLSPYAASKAAGEAYCQAFTKCYGIQATTLRFFNVYGPKNENNPYGGVITNFIRKAKHNQTLTVEGDGEQTRDFIHVSDIVKAVMLTLETKELHSEIFNVCTGVPTSINGLITALLKVTAKNLPVKHAPARVGDIRFSYGDASKAADKLGFKAIVSLPEGLKLLLEADEH
jgi:UDP-glucose 4-epimerase